MNLSEVTLSKHAQDLRMLCDYYGVDYEMSNAVVVVVDAVRQEIIGLHEQAQAGMAERIAEGIVKGMRDAGNKDG